VSTILGAYQVDQAKRLKELEAKNARLKRTVADLTVEGLKVPPKQPKRSRLWLNDGSCIRLAPTHRNHVCSWDFVFDRTRDGRTLKLMVVIDEFTRRRSTLCGPD